MKYEKINFSFASIYNYILWTLKTFIQNLNLLTRLPEYRFNNKSYKSKQKLISHRASWKMIEKEAEKLNHIIKKRKENKKAWDEVLSITCPFLKSIPNNSIPYFSTYSYKPNKENINQI